MITDNHREEQLSRAYIHAVVSHAGYIFEPSTIDYGVDGAIRSVNIRNGRRFVSGHSLDVQLKATTNWFLRNGEIVYDLEVKTYNDLVERFNETRATPMILVILCLPDNQNEWLTISTKNLIMRHCCYWCRVGDLSTLNDSTKRIKIPVENILNQVTVVDLLEKVKKGESIS